jgi:hypothetical protein
MADRTSAGLFARIFILLAKEPTTEHKKIAKEIYSFTKDYDFDNDQMEANAACLKLEIAFSDGEVTLWPEDSGYEEAKQKYEKENKGWKNYNYKRR